MTGPRLGGMANVILGLLLLRPMSLYDLVQAFGAGVSLFYSASSGSIKRALDDLVARGLVEVDEVRPGTRGRKVHRVTPQGRRAFEEWMHAADTESDAERAALARLYFLGLLDPPARAAVLDGVRTRLADELARLQAVERAVQAAAVPEHLAEVARYQRATLDYGMAGYRHALDWLATHVAP